MADLDKSKKLFLNATLRVSKYTSNTFVLTLAQEKLLCEDLHELGYRSNERAWVEYKKTIEIKIIKHLDKTAGPAHRRHVARSQSG